MLGFIFTRRGEAMSHLIRSFTKTMLAVGACAMLGGGILQYTGLLPQELQFVSPVHAEIGDSLLPVQEPIKRRPPDQDAIQYWYDQETAKEQARNERNLRKIDLRFQEQWPGTGDERQRSYDRARQREMDRYEREQRELEREYKQKFAR
ncbi:hypothetical protein V6C53_03640 [Desulfocurvibacter africanus]|uniref:hypothetical protein n=1 Tax=Desulfocurvibacter africanus TaxID=873 RepID=UPI002FD9D31F